MIDYQKLPREELIKELECWRDLAVKRQIVFFNDIKDDIDRQIAQYRKEYTAAAKDAEQAAAKHNLAAYEYAKKTQTRTDDVCNNYSYYFAGWRARPCVSVFDAVMRALTKKKEEKNNDV